MKFSSSIVDGADFL